MQVMDDSTIVEQFKALADPVRWTIVRELASGTRCACQLSQVTESAPNLLSYHLGVLRDAGLVTGTRRGRWVDYSLVETALDDLIGTLREPQPDSR
jgi:ArsR family transcriptional regulator